MYIYIYIYIYIRLQQSPLSVELPVDRQQGNYRSNKCSAPSSPFSDGSVPSAIKREFQITSIRATRLYPGSYVWEPWKSMHARHFWS